MCVIHKCTLTIAFIHLFPSGTDPLHPLVEYTRFLHYWQFLHCTTTPTLVCLCLPQWVSKFCSFPILWALSYFNMSTSTKRWVLFLFSLIIIFKPLCKLKYTFPTDSMLKNWLIVKRRRCPYNYSTTVPYSVSLQIDYPYYGAVYQVFQFIDY